jgi:acetyltransferase
MCVKYINVSTVSEYSGVVSVITIKRCDAQQGDAILDELVTLLKNVVDDGASIGFLAPLDEQMAREYWQGVLDDVRRGTRILIAALDDGHVVGSIQLDLPTKPNASHRAEVQKLMVHTEQRGRGLGKMLLTAIEEAARGCNRTMLVLDTRRGDVAEGMYHRHGYTVAGIMPQYARSSSGQLDDSVFFYRFLE